MKRCRRGSALDLNSWRAASSGEDRAGSPQWNTAERSVYGFRDTFQAARLMKHIELWLQTRILMSSATLDDKMTFDITNRVVPRPYPVIVLNHKCSRKLRSDLTHLNPLFWSLHRWALKARSNPGKTLNWVSHWGLGCFVVVVVVNPDQVQMMKYSQPDPVVAEHLVGPQWNTWSCRQTLIWTKSWRTFSQIFIPTFDLKVHTVNHVVV